MAKKSSPLAGMKPIPFSLPTPTVKVAVKKTAKPKPTTKTTKPTSKSAKKSAPKKTLGAMVKGGKC